MPTILTYAKPYYDGTKSLDGNQYRFTFYWNTTTEKWYMSMIGLSVDITIRGVALLPGKELIGKHGYGNYLGEMWLVDNSGLGENPTYAGMGDRWTLEYTSIES